MSLTNRPAPALVISAFSYDIDSFLSPPATTTVGHIGVQPLVPSPADLGGRLAAPSALQVFRLNLTDAAANLGVTAAVPAGWRLFVALAAEKSIYGRVVQLPNGHKLTAMYYGDQVWARWQAWQGLDSLPITQTHNYEVRLLSVPGLNLEAFWLVALDPGDTDLAVPFPASPNQRIAALNGEAWYPMPVFSAAIRPLATQRLLAPATHGS